MVTLSEDQPLAFQRDVVRRELALEERRLEGLERETSRKAGGVGSSVVTAFVNAGLLWLIFGTVFLGVFLKLSESIPFALVIGLVFVGIIVWRSTGARA